MSYQRHIWVKGEGITVARLNNIEDGIEEALQQSGADQATIADCDELFDGFLEDDNV